MIGSGGKNIRQIVAETGVEINVEDDGTVTAGNSHVLEIYGGTNLVGVPVLSTGNQLLPAARI